ncbi:hypothetical protein SISSUDRAFT_1039443 [Sistotremastrum suecicum HHB10207 ss-3]|uniref:Kinetochore protein NDC80 n=1 Tax=Sistotremastrum suecicum HHB10207 ss-3 TaxID=1314776 RepID=A0A166IX45_9AGAM|nr:hypothetical protein SISSUDRAFT_1039443 [Sistotremastrum suecicum HHB10207 ss-3]
MFKFSHDAVPSSNIPMPSLNRMSLAPGMGSSSNLRTSQNNRMSIAGPPGRAPLQPTPLNTGIPGSNPRQSILKTNHNPLLMSARKTNAGYGQTPARNGSRRASQWGGAMAPPLPGVPQPIKDPRPVREKAFQAQMSRTIHTFLSSTDCPQQLHPKMFKEPPTSVIYWTVIEWLVHQLDPNYPAAKPTVSAWPNDFIAVLKLFRYPFADAIDKKSLTTVGGLHSWPAMLAALHWLVLLCIARTEYLKSDDPTLQDVEQIPEVFSDEIHQWALAFDYYDAAYGVFLAGEDEFPNERAYIEERYTKQSAQVLKEVEDLKVRHAELAQELKKLTSSPAPVLKLRENHKKILSDTDKIAQWYQHSEKRKNKTGEDIAREEAEIAADQRMLDELLAEQKVLEATVAAQNLSPEEVMRMNAEDASLDRVLNDLKTKSKEVTKSTQSLEITVANRTDSVEQAIHEYMTLLYRLGLHPHTPDKFSNMSFGLELNGAASNPKDLVKGDDLRTVIRPALITIADMKRKERGILEDERVRITHDLDNAEMDGESLQQKLQSEMMHLEMLNQQVEDIRETSQREGALSSAEIRRLESELAAAKAAALSSGVGVKARLQALQIAYQEQVEQTERMREETVRAIVKNTSDMCNFKEQVSGHLINLRRMAEEN